MPELSRRAFCCALASIAAGCSSVPRYLLRDEDSRRIPISAFDEQGKLLIIRPRRKPVLIIREGTGFHALLMTCTHRGCVLRARPSDLVCPCHGSRFDLQGQVLEGPAQRPLTPIPLSVSPEGVITI